VGSVGPSPTSPDASALLAVVAFDANGLVPVIAQEARTGMIRMVAWANRDALAETLATGAACFWSRSRQAPWRKGETSGNTLAVREVRIDCDGDVVLYLVDAEGPSCHTGATSCFFRRVGADGALVADDGPPDPPAVIVARVAEVIANRRRDRPEKSYVVSLLDKGFPKINAKISEEAGELVEALPAGDAAHTAHEAADLLFHVLVGLEAAGVSPDAVFAELARRFGVSGIDEKASRKK
jgi:phosphoribosyl-ATP pyrophosphohydrolase/phosphoribosyl-AMP cyclohydrolase